MADFQQKIGRRMVYWTDHALDRWWERCQANETNGRSDAVVLLKQKLESARIDRDLPAWSKLSLWHRALAEGFLPIDENSGFVINRNPSGDYVAVTYIERVHALA